MNEVSQIPVYPAMNFSQLLGRIFRLLRTDFRTQLGIAVPPAIAFFLGYGVLFTIAAVTFSPSIMHGKQPQVSAGIGAMTAGLIPFMFVYLIAVGLFQSAAAYAAVNADCGMRVSVRESYKVALDRAGHFIRLILSVYGICFLPAILIEAVTIGGVAIILANKSFPPVLIVLVPVAVLLLITAMIAGLIVALRLSLVFPASVFECLDVRKSIKRSWELTRGVVGRIFLVLLVVYAALYIVMMLAMIIAFTVASVGFVFSSGAMAHPSPQTIGILVICVGGFYVSLMCAFGALFWMGIAASLSVIYNEQRMRLVPPAEASAPEGVPA